MAGVGERGERGAGGRRRVGEARVEALGALVHDRPRLQKVRGGNEDGQNCHLNRRKLSNRLSE